MAVFGGPLGSFRVAPFEPGPNALIVSMGETLGKIVSFFVKPGKECADRLLVCLAHNITMARATSTSKRGRVHQTYRPRCRCWGHQHAGRTSGRAHVGAAIHGCVPEHIHTGNACSQTKQTNAVTEGLTSMTALLDKTLKREVRIGDRAYIVAISPLTLKLTPKGKRKGLELNRESLVSGDTALAAALNASVGKLAADASQPKQTGRSGSTARCRRRIRWRSAVLCWRAASGDALESISEWPLAGAVLFPGLGASEQRGGAA